MNLRQAVVFSILMQNGQGIMDKHPSYLLEKLHSAEIMEHPERLLDLQNRRIFEVWKEKWKVTFD